MALYLLTVKDRLHDSWRGFYVIPDKIVVRAASPARARDVGMDTAKWASGMEGAGTNRRLIEYPDLHPILNPEVTSCEELSADGDERVFSVEQASA